MPNLNSVLDPAAICSSTLGSKIALSPERCWSHLPSSSPIRQGWVCRPGGSLRFTELWLARCDMQDGWWFWRVMGYSPLHMLMTHLSSNKRGSETWPFRRLNPSCRGSCFTEAGILLLERVVVSLWINVYDRLSSRRGRKPWLICNRLWWR